MGQAPAAHGHFGQVPAQLLPLRLLFLALLLGPASLSPPLWPMFLAPSPSYWCTGARLAVSSRLAGSQPSAFGAVTREVSLRLASVLHVGLGRAVSYLRRGAGLRERQECHRQGSEPRAGDNVISAPLPPSLPLGRTHGLRSPRTGRCASTTWRCTTGPCTSA